MTVAGGGGSGGVESVANVTDIHETLDFGGGCRGAGRRPSRAPAQARVPCGGLGRVRRCRQLGRAPRAGDCQRRAALHRSPRLPSPPPPRPTHPLHLPALHPGGRHGRLGISQLDPPTRLVPLTAGGRHGRLGIWSIQWSADSREIVAGTSDPGIRVYDMMASRCVAQAGGHGDDVNAVAYAERDVPHTIFSGSDDHYVKVRGLCAWDGLHVGWCRERQRQACAHAACSWSPS